MRWFLAVLVVSTLLMPSLLGAQQSTPVKPVAMAGVPLPSDAELVPPGPDVPKEEAAFSGEWFGKWSDDLPGILLVEEIQTNHKAVVVYAWGTGRSVHRAGWSRERATFANGELQLPKFENGAIVVYRMRADGTLEGTYTFRGGVSHIVMKHVDAQK